VQKPGKYGTSNLRTGGGGGEHECDPFYWQQVRDYGQDKVARHAGVYDTRMRFQLGTTASCAIASGVTNIAIG
jgi:hypothetical protein